MFRFSLLLSTVILSFFIISSCCKGDPCPDYLQVEDVFIQQQSSFQQASTQMTLYPSIAYELRKDLLLQFQWKIGDEIYEGETLVLKGQGVKEGSLTISNPGCSIVKTFNIDFDLGQVKE